MWTGDLNGGYEQAHLVFGHGSLVVGHVVCVWEVGHEVWVVEIGVDVETWRSGLGDMVAVEGMAVL